VTVGAPSLLSAGVRSFLSATSPRYATLATINHDGTPHQIVVWYLLRGDEIVVNSRHGRRWPANLRRDGRASITVYEGEDAVTLDCTLDRDYAGDAGQADIAEMAWRYDAAETAGVKIARFRNEQRITFVLRPVRAHLHGDPR
jgi:hypothetical protein